MKKQRLFKSVLAAGALLAAGICHAQSQGTWQPASNNGGNNSTASGSCYLVTFDAETEGIRTLIGQGRVDGDYLTGFVWVPGLSNRAHGDCKNYPSMSANKCAWWLANVNTGYVAYVSGLKAIDLSPATCY